MPRRLIAAISLGDDGRRRGSAARRHRLPTRGVVWPYFLLAGATGVASAIGWPASQALTPEVVPVDLVPNAVALRSVASTTAVITGPAVGGLLFAWKPEAVYALAAFLFAVAAVCMIALRVPRRARDERRGGRPRRRSSRGSASSGGRRCCSARSRSTSSPCSSAAGSRCCRSTRATSSTSARSGSASCAPRRRSARFAAALLVARRPLRRPAGPDAASSSSSSSARCTSSGARRSWIPLTLAALAVAGFVDMISVNIRSTTVAMVTPNALRGRVGAVEMVFISASNELGAFESGAVAALVRRGDDRRRRRDRDDRDRARLDQALPRPRADGEARGPAPRAGSYAREVSVDRRSVWPYVDGEPGRVHVLALRAPDRARGRAQAGRARGRAGAPLLLRLGGDAGAAARAAWSPGRPSRSPRAATSARA